MKWVAGPPTFCFWPSADPTVQSPDLARLVGAELELLGFECVKLEVVGSAHSPVVRLFIDKPGGVTVGECAMVSRTLGLVLDREDPFPGRYLLEVSSPGSNRPLVAEAHFQRFSGSEARVVVERAGEERVTHLGRIRSCIGGVLVLETDGGEVEVGLRDVIRANLINQEYKIDKKREKVRRPSRDKWRRGEEEE